MLPVLTLQPTGISTSQPLSRALGCSGAQSQLCPVWGPQGSLSGTGAQSSWGWPTQSSREHTAERQPHACSLERRKPRPSNACRSDEPTLPEGLRLPREGTGASGSRGSPRRGWALWVA